jgi:hypothetical protein
VLLLQGDALYAMELALSLEKLNFQKLRELHDIASDANDAQMCDFIEGTLLAPQVRRRDGGVYLCTKCTILASARARYVRCSCKCTFFNTSSVCAVAGVVVTQMIVLECCRIANSVGLCCVCAAVCAWCCR